MNKTITVKTSPRKFKWVVEIEVDKFWVEDGFNLTDERAHDLMTNDLTFAYGHEFKTKVLSAPDKAAIMKVQGYSLEEIKKQTSGKNKNKPIESAY